MGIGFRIYGFRIYGFRFGDVRASDLGLTGVLFRGYGVDLSRESSWS